MNPLLFLSLLLLTLASCVRHRELVNFNRAELDYTQPEDIDNAAQLEIQAEDLLRINVYSFNPEAAAPFNIEQEGQRGGMVGMNQQGGGGQGNYQLELFMGYLVDENGYIDFPVLGQIEVGGLTIEAAKNKITQLVEPYLTDAVVSMRFLNLKITVLGEVNNPGTIRLSNKRVTLLEAIGLAGDLTVYANRTNVLVMREEQGVRRYARLDLQTSELFNSPYFYLQQNDVIYVEPLPARVATVADPAQRFISYASGALSIVTLIIAFTRR